MENTKHKTTSLEYWLEWIEALKQWVRASPEGIYSNLAPLRDNGVTEHDIAVVLIQDGILKLVKDRVRRTYAKDEHSMLEFYR